MADTVSVLLLFYVCEGIYTAIHNYNAGFILEKGFTQFNNIQRLCFDKH